MSKYRKPFLKALLPLWEKRFPAWRSGEATPCFWARPDSTFSDRSASESTGRFFHAVIDFTPKKRGAFTADILITSSQEGFARDCNPPHRWWDHIPELLEGTYRIGHFYREEDHWWHLVDEAAESKRFWESIPNMPPMSLLLGRREGDWYASSYDRPLAEIVAEAASHFCDVFEQYVIPKLHRKA
jgi:hypothetical protein